MHQSNHSILMFESPNPRATKKKYGAGLQLLISIDKFMPKDTV